MLGGDTSGPEVGGGDSGVDPALQLISLSLSHSLFGLRIGDSPVGREAFTLILKDSYTWGHLACKPSPAQPSPV